MHKFDVVADFYKARSDDGRMLVSVLASTTAVDRQDERVLPSFIQSMNRQAAEGAVELIAHHQDPFALGKSVGYLEEGDDKFVPEFELDAEHPMAQKLFDAVAAGECAWQASIGGSAIGEKLYDPEAGRVIRTLRDGTLDHVALTRRGRAANPETGFLAAVLKSVDWEAVAEPASPEATQAEGPASPEGEQVEKTSAEPASPEATQAEGAPVTRRELAEVMTLLRKAEQRIERLEAQPMPAAGGSMPVRTEKARAHDRSGAAPASVEQALESGDREAARRVFWRGV